jgi:hypothetical protein
VEVEGAAAGNLPAGPTVGTSGLRLSRSETRCH